MIRQGDAIWWGDKLVTEANATLAERLMNAQYVYAAVATIDHRPLYLTAQLACAASSYETLFGTRPAYDVATLRQRILRLQDRNRMPRQGNTLHICLLPPADTFSDRQPDMLIFGTETTICRSYELMSVRPTALLTNYELPFAGHRTSLSLTADGYMQAFARRKGYHIALHTNRANRLVSCGDYPVGIVRDGTLATPPQPAGTPKSVELRLLQQACSLAGIPCEERDIATDELTEADEVIVFGSHGLHSVLSCSGRYYYNLAAQRLARTLDRLTAEGLKA